MRGGKGVRKRIQGGLQPVRLMPEVSYHKHQDPVSLKPQENEPYKPSKCSRSRKFSEKLVWGGLKPRRCKGRQTDDIFMASRVLIT